VHTEAISPLAWYNVIVVVSLVNDNILGNWIPNPHEFVKTTTCHGNTLNYIWPLAHCSKQALEAVDQNSESILNYSP
jgi:hypothetical protein